MEINKGGFSRPEKIFEQLELNDAMEAADFGCGHGYFTIPLAKRLPKGRVFAVDVVKEALEAVKNMADLEKVDNILTVQANLEIMGGSKLKDDSMDLVLLRNILYQSRKKEEILREAKRVLKSEGRIIVVEWKTDSVMAPKEGWLISEDDTKKTIEREGMFLEKELEIDGHHYGLVFRKR